MGRKRHRGLRTAGKVLGTGLVLFLLSQTFVGTRVMWTLRRGPVTTSAYMRADLALGQDESTDAKQRRLLVNLAHQWVDLDAISPIALEVLVSREDQGLVTRRIAFDVGDFTERGLAWLRGDGDQDPSGSTIPQQLAKNLFTRGERSGWRKIYEADHALALRLVASPRRILEVYANIIEFGPGVYGVCAASWYYFDKRPAALTDYDMATLVGLMPDPKHHTIYPTHPNVEFARVKRKRYLGYLQALPAPRRAEVFDVVPERASATCSQRPASLARRLRAAQTKQGYPRYPDDQSFWPRLTRQYARGNLEDADDEALANLPPGFAAELERRIPYTPGARPAR